MDEMKLSNPNYKIGIKQLTDAQMKTALPMYELIETKIEKIRENAEKTEYVDNADFFENLKYDNIFSILGGRGAGKTSILLTLYKNFQNQNNNIILPFIMPELIENDESIVSWIISAISINLKQIENKFKEIGFVGKSKSYKEFCESSKMFERCSFNERNSLRKKFEILRDSYYSTEYRNHSNNADYSTLRELLANGVESSFNLINLFLDYWNTLVEAYKQIIKELSNTETTPLIFVFIDDADLKPQIINELLFIIPKYLSHPNVVVFVSASHKTLSYVVKNHMYKSITQNPIDITSLMKIEYDYNGDSMKNGQGRTVKFHDLRYGKEYNKIRQLSDEILRKIFPVYNRFYIKKHDRYEEKGLLQISETDSPDCSSTIKVSDKIFNKVKNFYSEILGMHSQCKAFKTEENIETFEKKKKNFKLPSPDNARNNFDAEFYLSFLGRYSRDINSVYYAFEDMLNSMKYLLKEYYENNDVEVIGIMPSNFNQSMYEIAGKFINAAVSSNQKLSIFSRFVPEMIKTQLLHWQLYVNYSKVIEIFREEKFIEDNKKFFEPFIEMMCLLNFVEQLIVLVVPQRRSCHGHEELQQLLRLCNVKIIKFKDDIDDMFRQYYLFYSINLIPNFDADRKEHRGSFIKGVLEFGLIPINEKESVFKADIIQYEEWYKLFNNVVFKACNLTARIDKYKNNLFILKELDFVDDNYNSLRVDYQVYLETVFRNKEDMFSQSNTDGKSLFDKKTFLMGEIEKLDISQKLVNLETSINNLVLFVKDDNFKDDLFAIIENVKDSNFELWRRIALLINQLSYRHCIIRTELISQLLLIDSVINKSEVNKTTYGYWWNNVKNELNKHLVLTTKCGKYEMYATPADNLAG